MSEDDTKLLPKHVGIILDGNRRWAKERGLAPMEGHKQGFEAFKVIADAGLERGIKNLSVFAFSTENWKRAKEEVSFLMSYIKIVLSKHIKELDEKNIRFIWLGTEEGLDQSIVKMFKSAEEKSKNNTAATFCLCFNYGGQLEIVDAVNKLHSENKPITTESLEANLYGGKDVPPIDFLIRTSGEQRISNFMLWRVAYSELYFTDKYWPDFNEKDLDMALAEYASRCRRFGG